MKKTIIFAVLAFFSLIILSAGLANSDKLETELDEKVLNADKAAVEFRDECMNAEGPEELLMCANGIKAAVAMCDDYPTLEICDSDKLNQFMDMIAAKMGYDI